MNPIIGKAQTVPPPPPPSADQGPDYPSQMVRNDSERWPLSPAASTFVRERARVLSSTPSAVLDDLVLVERRRVEGAI